MPTLDTSVWMLSICCATLSSEITAHAKECGLCEQDRKREASIGRTNREEGGVTVKRLSEKENDLA